MKSLSISSVEFYLFVLLCPSVKKDLLMLTMIALLRVSVVNHFLNFLFDLRVSYWHEIWAVLGLYRPKHSAWATKYCLIASSLLLARKAPPEL